jgi:hypothetical protein
MTGVRAPVVWRSQSHRTVRCHAGRLTAKYEQARTQDFVLVGCAEGVEEVGRWKPKLHNRLHNRATISMA